MKDIKGQLGRAFSYLETKIQETDIDTFNKIQNNELEVMEGDFYVRAAVPAGAGPIIELTDDSRPRAIGITKLDKGQLDKSKHLAFERCCVRFGGQVSANTDATIAGADYSENQKAADGTALIVAAIKAAVLSIQVNGKKIFEKSVQTLTFNGRDQSSNQDGFYVCDIPRFIEAEKDVRIFLELPKGVIIPGTAGTHFQLLEFYAPVVTTVVRNK